VAFSPGVSCAHRQVVQPSTVAYTARRLIHRYHMLGVLDEDGFQVHPMDVMFTDTSVQECGDNVTPFQALRAIAKARGCPIVILPTSLYATST